MATVHKELANPGVDAVSGHNEGGEDDTSNYPHIESFVSDLAHSHELHHAMYHIAKRLADKDSEPEVTMNDYEKLKKSTD